MRLLPLLLAGAALATSGCVSTSRSTRHSIAQALVFHAPFDGTADAAFGGGDLRIHTGPKWDAPRTSAPGLPPEGTVKIAPGQGRHGDAIRFEKKIPQLVGYRVPGNFPLPAPGWSGTVSFWLRVTPDEDIEPGYSDVIQVTSKAWDDASFFVEFTKDEKPREMRLGAYADKTVWNPEGRDWGKIPLEEKPLARVIRPPFRRDTWTQVTFTWENYNTGRTDGRTQLYLDGQPAGSISPRTMTYTWDAATAVMMLGLAYTGWMDDLAVFSRALTPHEVAELHRLPAGVGSLRPHRAANSR